MDQSIYKIYTENVGNLTPMIADQLKLDEDEYGSEAVMEAIKVAVFRNARNMKYIEAVLRNRNKPRADYHMTDAAIRKYSEGIEVDNKSYKLDEADLLWIKEHGS